MKNIKTRFGKLGLEVERRDSAGTRRTISSFLCCRPAAVQNIQLRKSFHRLFQASDPQKIAITDAKSPLAMPLWVDPLAPPIQRKVKLAALMIPAISLGADLARRFLLLDDPGRICRPDRDRLRETRLSATC
ncbi:MAG: hypothetical protein MZV70_40010 [Desulfobacterales bacterium]|nr:hypothetical protein [Desulfobacterales bacterium]